MTAKRQGKVNPVAKSLRLPALAQKRVEGRKGYKRRPKHKEKEA